MVGDAGFGPGAARLRPPGHKAPFTVSLTTQPKDLAVSNAPETGADEEWLALIADSASLPAGEALALTDSLWAGFRAGEVSPSLLVEAARKMALNP